MLPYLSLIQREKRRLAGESDLRREQELTNTRMRRLCLGKEIELLYEIMLIIFLICQQKKPNRKIEERMTYFG